MNNTPIKKKMYSLLLLLYLLAVGNNSQNDIWSIIPAIMEKRIPSIKSFITFLKNKYARRAPKGSEIADIPVYKIAFFLLPVL